MTCNITFYFNSPIESFVCGIFQAYVQYPVPFEIQIWQEEAFASGLWSQRTCKLIYKYKWVKKFEPGPIKVNISYMPHTECVFGSKIFLYLSTNPEVINPKIFSVQYKISVI